MYSFTKWPSVYVESLIKCVLESFKKMQTVVCRILYKVCRIFWKVWRIFYYVCRILCQVCRICRIFHKVFRMFWKVSLDYFYKLIKCLLDPIFEKTVIAVKVPSIFYNICKFITPDFFYMVRFSPLLSSLFYSQGILW